MNFAALLDSTDLATVAVLSALAAALAIGVAVELARRLRATSGALRQSQACLGEAHVELHRAASVDPLTSVPNRRRFEERLQQAVARVDQQRHPVAADGRVDGEVGHGRSLGLLFIDLDGFKAINDSDGHLAGDSVLIEVAQRLRRTVRASDTLARVGGDEFVLLHEDIDDVADVQALAERIVRAFAEPFALPSRRVTLSCSIGIVTYPEMPAADRLLAAADAAMVVAKRAGGNGHAVFEARMQEDVSVQLDLLQGLREALGSGGLSLHYQPKWDAHSREIAGVEALLRWVHPERGPISPAVFVPIAERFGLIVQIGDWVIDEACRQLACWESEGRQMSVAINLSAYQLRLPDLADRVQAALVRHRVAPRHVICEITESVAMEDTSRTQSLLERLTALGVQLSIDDFGTGYSSLAVLRQMRPHELKIDRSFVRDLGATTGDARAVIDAIVRLAHALGLRVVAEGVETAEQREALVALGCDVLQGFLLGRPSTADALRFEQPAPSIGRAGVERVAA